MYKSASKSLQGVLRRTTRLDHMYRSKPRLMKRLDKAAKKAAIAEKGAYDAAGRTSKLIKRPKAST